MSNLWNLCHSLEDRTLRTSGCVPNRNGVVIGASGVTIGYGIDLGQMGETEIANWPAEVKALVRPYLGKSGPEAQEYLTAHPLTLTQGQCKAMQTALESDRQALLERHCGDMWAAAPDCVKSALISLHWQLYSIWHRKDCHAMWIQARGLNWRPMAAEVRTCGPAGYETRRNAEADYIEKGLENA